MKTWYVSKWKSKIQGSVIDDGFINSLYNQLETYVLVRQSNTTGGKAIFALAQPETELVVVVN